MLKYLAILLLLFPLLTFGQQDTTVKQGKDSANQKFILHAFKKAYDYMSNDQYDLAQSWLNKIYLRVSYRKPSLFSYYLTTCQAEVYYYNNLHQLGLQESKKGLNIALILKDSVLIADANNFIGLFYLNDNKLASAKQSFQKALKYASQPPYKKPYIDLTKPHHILGNLAETFEKLNMPDSAIFYSLLSLKKAAEINSARGIATGALNIGNAFLLAKQIDSAQKYFELTKTNSIKAGEFDVELTGYSGLAECAAANKNRPLAFSYLNDGFLVLKKFPQLNDFYAGMFIEVAIKIYRQYGDLNMLNKTLELKSTKQTATYNRNNLQIQSLLLTGIDNEKTIFNLELAESQNKQSLANTRLYIVLLVLLLIIIAFFAYRYYVLQRLRLANVRSKISQDLHDEVGATLSGIAMYSYITKEQIKNDEPLAVSKSLDIIKDNASEMVAKLNDIVWAVNPIQDHLSALIDRLKEFTLQVAAIRNIKADFVYSAELLDVKIPMEARKNIYLICKEAINNSLKYSESTLLEARFEVHGKQLHITINDNGKGFSKGLVTKGNGLINMASRAEEISAKLVIDVENGGGTKISLTCKCIS